MKALDQRWEELFDLIRRVEQANDSDRVDMAAGALGHALTAVRLVQPFGWMDWIEKRDGPVTRAEAKSLSLFDCVRTMTTLCRGDRFNEGLLVGATRGGLVGEVCRRAHALSGGFPIPPLPERQEKM